MADDQRDFSGRYNTVMSPDDEARFQSWVAAQSQATGRPVQNDMYDYDLRGWWKQNPGADMSGAHLTDEFKKPNHPTFSTNSQYHGADGMQGGQWSRQQDGSWTFAPGSSNLYSTPELGEYFKHVEPGNKLILPES